MNDIKNIWEGVRAGNRKAQKALYEHSCDDIMNICKRYLPDVSYNDAFQESYIKIFTKAKSYDANKGSLNAWMARIAVNECLLFLRKSKKMVLFDITNAGIEPEIKEDIISDMTSDEIYKEVLNLPAGYRIVFNLYVVEGFSHKEIAEKLNISASSSRSQLARAKNVLRNVIKKKSNLISHEADK